MSVDTAAASRRQNGRWRGSLDYYDSFWDRVGVGGADECWPWLAGRLANGYGQFRGRSQNEKSHRVALAMHTREPVPDEAVVCHTCDNPPCCNPAHLFLGTHADNARDSREKGRRWYQSRTLCRRGLHEWTVENTFLIHDRNGNGVTSCRLCRADSQRARYHRTDRATRKKKHKAYYAKNRSRLIERARAYRAALKAGRVTLLPTLDPATNRSIVALAETP
jgi:hypothetical protein